jgi:diguanylate cyclase (GGDEF)-like protein
MPLGLPGDDGLTLRQTVSVGVAVLDAGMADGAALLDAADRQLYQAKRAGRNQVRG